MTIPKIINRAKAIYLKIKDDLTPFQEIWSLGKECGEFYHSLYVDGNGKIRRRGEIPDTLKLFDTLFPGILNICKGDIQREAILFFMIQIFRYGLRLPGLGYEFAESESREILNSEPGDKRRIMFG